MIISVIGGGGFRTPLLIAGLIERHPRIPVMRVVLHDVDAEALRVVRILTDAQLARAGHPFEVVTTTDLDEALDRPAYLITSIRVGGLAARIVDEQVPLRHGIIGQETTGPGGWAMALRTIPVLLEVRERLRRRAPGAWILNFTNPAGLITQALTDAGDRRTIGICDSPVALGRHIAAVLGVPPEAMRLDYLGLNHLGWVRAVWVEGRDRLPEILADDERIRAVYGRPLFTPDEVRRLGLLPNEYLHYYYHHDEAVRRMREAGQTRGEVIAEVAARLRTAVLEAAAKGDDPLPVYQAAVFARRSTYMATETGQTRDLSMMGGHVEGGYARAALSVIEGMLEQSERERIVNTLNQLDASRASGAQPGTPVALTDFAPSDIVEVPCRFSAQGPAPRSLGGLPPGPRDLAQRVKAYERATAAAATRRSWGAAVDALASHPLVASRSQAETIARDLRTHLSPHLNDLSLQGN